MNSRFDFKAAIEAEKLKLEQDLAAEQKKKAKTVRGNSNAYFEFIQGEESLEIEEEDDIFKYAAKMFTVLQQRADFYDPKCPGPPYDDRASAALLSICNDIRVKTEHVIDLLERGADPNYSNGTRFNETPIFGLIR